MSTPYSRYFHAVAHLCNPIGCMHKSSIANSKHIFENKDGLWHILNSTRSHPFDFMFSHGNPKFLMVYSKLQSSGKGTAWRWTDPPGMSISISISGGSWEKTIQQQSNTHLHSLQILPDRQETGAQLHATMYCISRYDWHCYNWSIWCMHRTSPWMCFGCIDPGPASQIIIWLLVEWYSLFPNIPSLLSALINTRTYWTV